MNLYDCKKCGSIESLRDFKDGFLWCMSCDKFTPKLFWTYEGPAISIEQQEYKIEVINDSSA